MDPQNVFSGDWSDEILYWKELVKFDGCALEGQCIYSEDRYCSRCKGFTKLKVIHQITMFPTFSCYIADGFRTVVLIISTLLLQIDKLTFLTYFMVMDISGGDEFPLLWGK
ncbi:hypothetical protein MTR_1g029290 [Medicago truncatula]|uniref:Uncharacterized protein n=2 Tax=Medicago truncatula TaxID=3880 RepID=A0A072VFU5_MEDTR|nr:hypothetical protein MTR_1g029290 [Medicago truncatula]